MGFLEKTGLLAAMHPERYRESEPPAPTAAEISAMQLKEKMTLVDQSATLTMRSMQNAAALAVYASQLSEMIPDGREVFYGLARGYAESQYTQIKNGR